MLFVASSLSSRLSVAAVTRLSVRRRGFIAPEAPQPLRKQEGDWQTNQQGSWVENLEESSSSFNRAAPETQCLPLELSGYETPPGNPD